MSLRSSKDSHGPTSGTLGSFRRSTVPLQDMWDPINGLLGLLDDFLGPQRVLTHLEVLLDHPEDILGPLDGLSVLQRVSWNF